MSRQLLNYRLGAGLSGLFQTGPFGNGTRNLSVFPCRNVFSKNSKHFEVPSSKECANEPLGSYRSFSTTCGSGSTSGLLFSSYKGVAAYQPTFKGGSSIARRHDHDSPITQKLAAARSSQEILQVFEYDADQMDVLSLVVAVDALFDTLKSEPPLSTKAKHQLLTSVGMQKILKQLRRRSPHMDPGDIINGIKLLSYLSAPGNHQTLQILLKLLSKHANIMDLQQLVYTQFLLDKLDPESKSPLSKALEFALPVVFESKLQTDIDRTDAQTVCDYLHYASKYKLSDNTLNFIVEVALSITDRLSAQSAKSIIWSLCDARYENPNHAPLLAWAYRKFSGNMDNLKLSDISTTISKAARKYSRRAFYFYDEDFVNEYCERLTKPDVNSLDVLWAVKTVSIFKHLNIEYMDRLGDIIASNPAHILNNDNLFAIFVRAISSLNYKPEKWHVFSSMLLEHPALSKNFGLAEVNLACDFLALDMFPDQMIRALFSSDGLEILEEFQTKHHPIYLILLYNAVKVLYPQYKGPLPPFSMVENWKELTRASNANSKQYPLKSALQSGLGGESYVINGLYHDGLHIDHGIVMRKGGYPVAVNSQSDSQSDCLSSINKPVESVIVLIKVFTPDMYCNNTKRLRGPPSLELKILESSEHPVVAVDQELWMELPDHEKIPYLMQRIRQKMEPLQWNQNWGDVIPP